MADNFFEGKRLYKLGRYRQALFEFLKVSEEPLEDTNLSYYVGLCYSKISDWDNALLYLESIVNSDDNILRIYQGRMILSYIYTITGRSKLAEFELNKLINDGFESPQVYSNYSYIYFENGNTDKSVEYLRKALEIDPNNANAMNSLGYILAEKEIDLEMALEYCKKALKHNPDSAAYLDSLGWAYYRVGKNDESRHYLKRAFDASPDNKLIALHLRTVIDKIDEIRKGSL
ncbi:MAG: tetratricopeptide repeat protein [Spirochaetales bacterium]|nr:tetratricopeptide repeat protein [Spirochaetales bacterium]